MTHARRVIGATASVALCLASACFAQDAARMEQIVQSYVDAGSFMGTVLVARGDTVVMSKAYGSANLEWKIPNTTTTKFRLGSVTKQFTAASILLLEERGKLSIADPVSKYLSNAPAAWEKITLHHLLTHTSGVPNFTNFPAYRTFQLSTTTPDKTIALFRDKPLDFAPGEKWNYSNSGYILLGAIIEKVSGVSYERFVTDNIFTPLGMKDSGYDSNSRIIERRATGYAPSPNGPVNSGFIDMSVPHGAGALYSTTEDLLRWQRGLIGHKVISAASLQKMMTPVKNDYGFGVFVATPNNRKMMQHGGGIQGFNTDLRYFPETSITVVVLSNLNGPASAIGEKLGQAANGEKVTLNSERREIPLKPEQLTPLAGVYELRPGSNLVITVEGGQLMVQTLGQPKRPVFAESESRFFSKTADVQLEFERNASGEVTHVIVQQGAAKTRAPRKPHSSTQ